MKRLNLYTSKDAENDVELKRKTGTEASVRKWKLLVNALNKIYMEMNQNCGLCYEHENCKTCSLYKCGDKGSDYTKSVKSLYVTLKKTERMLSSLETLRKKEKKEE